MFIIRKEFSFSAGHCLLNLPQDHPCVRNHGHNYVVIVELRANALDKIGFVMDYRDLDTIKEYLDKAFDHKFLNDFCTFNPTAENIALHLYAIFKEQFPLLYAIEVCETPKTMARYEQFTDTEISDNNN
jgi:6-pyruvoyltetrahydropterin/6-carboxytetrahydropterin synthase